MNFTNSMEAYEIRTTWFKLLGVSDQATNKLYYTIFTILCIISNFEHMDR